MDCVRMGIIGIGNMGSAHARNITEGKVDRLVLTAVCDTDEARRAWAEENLPGVRVFEDYSEMLTAGICDAVLIATPHRLHPYIAAEAMRAGLHVLSEKPAAVSVSEAQTAIDAAEETGKIYGLMFNQRTNPIFRKIREMIRGGELGEIKRSCWIVTNWYRTQAYYDSGSWRASWNGEGGGVLLNQCPHNLDIWQWLVGMPVRVRAFCRYGRYHNIDVEDDVTIYTEYANGASGTFITTTGEFPGTNRLEIAGDLGKVVAENGTLKFWKLEQPEPEVRFSSEQGFCKIPAEEIDIPITEVETAHLGILQDFTNAVLDGSSLLAPGSEGIRSLTISNAAHLSDWTGRMVGIPFDPAEFDELMEEHREDEEYSEKKQDTAEKLKGEYSERWSVRW